MRRASKWLACLVAVALVGAACGGEEEQAQVEITTTAPIATEASDTMTEDRPATTAAPTTMMEDQPGAETPTTMMEDPPTEIATDVGVDLENGVIKVGMLADLTGIFGPVISLVTAGVDAFWKDVNARGGVHGLQVELVYRDTVYSVDNHVQFYEELKDEVVAFGHSTGSPHTVAILEDLAEDGILAIPLTWYSGWSDPTMNSNLLPHGTPYCIEAMNMIGYLSDVAKANGIASPTLALATFPGDYGLDSAVGAKAAAETLGVEVVYDGSGKVLPGQDNSPVGGAIAQSGADIVWVAASPTVLAEIYGAALSVGFQAMWAGPPANWNPALVAPNSPLKDALARDYYGPAYFPPYTDDTPGMANVRDVMDRYAPDAPKSTYLVEGFIEGFLMLRVLEIAYAAGDLTQAGVLAAAKSIEELDFDGVAPTERYAGEPNDIVQRTIWIGRADPQGLAEGIDATGIRTIESFYTHPVAADYVFEGACYKLS